MTFQPTFCDKAVQCYEEFLDLADLPLHIDNAKLNYQHKRLVRTRYKVQDVKVSDADLHLELLRMHMRIRFCNQIILLTTIKSLLTPQI